MNASSLLDPPVEFLKVKVSDGATLDGWLLQPRNFDPAKKYSAVVYVYGEPLRQTATNAWPGKRGLFHRALAATGYEKLINRLVELGKPSEFMEYPNRSHSISEGSGTLQHLYNLLGCYIEEHLPAGPR